jgi:hypothetical protein
MGLQDVKNVANLATMPSATDFRNNPDSITSSYVVLVSEHLGVLQPTPPAGTRQVILPANFQLHLIEQLKLKARVMMKTHSPATEPIRIPGPDANHLAIPRTLPNINWRRERRLR